MPSLFTVSVYKVFFWSNENGEPIHVHVCKGKLSPHATKIWLTKNGGCILANNGSHIPPKELNSLMEFISAQFFMICDAWKEHFVIDTIYLSHLSIQLQISLMQPVHSRRVRLEGEYLEVLG